jgi:hypothetical protein
VNFVHILQENAEHIAAMIARCIADGAIRVEPTAEAEAQWVKTVHETSTDMRKFAAECTPGYYNGEGTASATGMTFSPGPIVFHRILREWRAGDMRDVLVFEDDLVPAS